MSLEVKNSIIWEQILTKWFFGVLDTPFMYLSRGITSAKIDFFNTFLKNESNGINERIEIKKRS